MFLALCIIFVWIYFSHFSRQFILPLSHSLSLTLKWKH